MFTEVNEALSVSLDGNRLRQSDCPSRAVLTLAQNITTRRVRARASGHETLNLYGSNHGNSAGQGAGRRLEGRAKMKMTQAQNIDILGRDIENVSNHSRGEC